MSARNWMSPGWMLLGWMVWGAPAKVVADPGGNPAPHADSTPAWPEGITWYYLDVDRFCNGDTSNDPPSPGNWDSIDEPREPGVLLGGDIAGLQSKLAYLSELGVGGLIIGDMLSVDFQHVDAFVGLSNAAIAPASPMTAGDRQFFDFVRAAHEKKMRVILDSGAGRTALNLVAGSTKWLDPNGDGNPSDGIDGWLARVTPLTNKPLLRKTLHQIRAVNPRAMLLGNGPDAENALGESLLDGFVDTRLAEAMATFVRDGTDQSITKLANTLQPSNRKDPTRRIHFSSWADPMGRSEVNPPTIKQWDAPARDRLRLATCVLMLGVKHPGIHWGDEYDARLSGGSKPPAPMPWQVRAANEGPGAEFSGELHELIKLLAGLRKAHQPLRTGTSDLFRIDENRKLFVFSRRVGTEKAVAVVNFSGKKQQVTISARWPRQRAVILSPQMRWGKQKNVPFVTGGSRQQADSWGDLTFWVDAMAMRLVILDGNVNP